MSSMSVIPLYQCHKKVHALKVLKIQGRTIEGENNIIVHLDDPWFERHNPEVGGYLVWYQDGYLSYSPAEAFENGYTKIDS